jgi:hypothetical protein
MVVMRGETVISPRPAGAVELPKVGTPQRTGVLHVTAAAVRGSVGLA